MTLLPVRTDLLPVPVDAGWRWRTLRMDGRTDGRQPGVPAAGGGGMLRRRRFRLNGQPPCDRIMKLDFAVFTALARPLASFSNTQTLSHTSTHHTRNIMTFNSLEPPQSPLTTLQID